MRTGFLYRTAACLLLIFMLLVVEKSYAVTANPRAVDYIQPDGTTLTIVLHGDEFVHWATTADGYTIMTNHQGFYEYAMTAGDGRLSFSGVHAHNAVDRSSAEIAFLSGIRPGLFFSKIQLDEMKALLKGSRSPNAPAMGGFPTTGTRKLLMILANFSNTTTTFSQSNFNNYMNQVNYNGSGSFKDYFLEVSYGLLTVNTTVTIWVTLPQTHDYYGPESKWGEFAYDAVVAANSQASVNYAEYDNNLDGVVDGVAIIHQGRGQEESGNPNDIWSHSWELSSAGYTVAQRTFDGVQVDAYTTMPEKNGSSMGTIGVMCHEFGHNLGAPDFYDTDYGTSGQYDGTGYWDVMADGCWNGSSGTKPAHPNAWIKYYFTWTNPTVLSTAQTKLLRNAQAYADVARYNTTTTNEYFLCENRQQTGFDVGIPGHGLIIYHVDGNYISSHMDANDINCTSHQGLYPEAANSTIPNGIMPSSSSTINTTGCSYPGTSSKTSFTDATTPNSKSWAGANTTLPLLSITENTSTKEVTFCFISCSSSNDPTSFTAVSAGSSQINLSWVKNASNDPVLVAYSLTPTFGVPVNGTAYSAGGTIPGGGMVIYNGTNTTFNHTALSPNTTYYYKAWSVLTGTGYSTGVTANASTQCIAVTSLPLIESFSGTSIPGCWSQVDHEGNGQIWQFGTITGQSPNPALTGNYAYLNSDFYGSGYSQDADLETPLLDLTAYLTINLQFNHYFLSYSGSSGSLSYSIDGGTSWTLIQDFTTTSSSNPSTFSQAVNAVAGQPLVKFKWNYTGTYGYYWAIDDVEITGTSAVTLSVTPSNQAVSADAGNTSFSVTCPIAWTAICNAPTWCTVTPSGTGNGTIIATYLQNSSVDQRIANITVIAPGAPDQTVTVTQAGAAPTLAVQPPNRDVTFNGGMTEFTVTSNSNWTAMSDAGWCTVTPSGSGNATLTANYLANVMYSQRTANIIVTVSGIPSVTVTVTQAPLVSLEELTSDGIRIFPNPSRGIFNIIPQSGNELSITVTVHDMNGKIILSQSFIGRKEYQIDLSTSPEGLYHMIIKLDDRLLVRKLSIVK